MSCGKEFVETFKKIDYPKADILNGEDFDWLFVENELFLNVVDSLSELRSF